MLGKVKQLERRRRADLIVIDAPAAGHAITFLLSPRGLLDAVRVGPVRTQAEDVHRDAHRPGAVPGDARDAARGDAGERARRHRVRARGPRRREARPGRRQRGARRRSALDGHAVAADAATRGRRRSPTRGARARRRRRASAASATRSRSSRPTGWPSGCRSRSSGCRSCSARSARPTSTRWPTRCVDGDRGARRMTAAMSDARRARRRAARRRVLRHRRRRQDDDRRGARARRRRGAAATRSSSRSTRRSGSPTRSGSSRWATPRTRSTVTGGTPTGTAPASGRLSASDARHQLDVRRAGAQRTRPSAEQAERILENRFYRNISGALSGTQEYMAMEKLYELHEEGGFDLIVVDTPPTRHALDFLDAPAAAHAPPRQPHLPPAHDADPHVPAGRGRRGADVPAHRRRRSSAAEVIDDIVAFFRAFEGMEQGFRERADERARAARRPGTAFVLVTSPRRDAVEEAEFFADAAAGERPRRRRARREPGAPRLRRESTTHRGSRAAAPSLG